MARTIWRRKKQSLRLLKRWLMLLLLVVMLGYTEKQLTPIISAMAAQKCHGLAVATIQQAVQEELAAAKDYGDYRQLMHIERDQSGRITLVSPDTMLLNQLNASLSLKLEQALSDLHRQSVAIPLGAISGSKLLAAVGPNIHVGFTIAATPRIELRDQFSSAGINQTKHSLSLLIQADLLIAVPFEPQKITVATTVLLAEGIIVGNTPDSYVNINAP